MSAEYIHQNPYLLSPACTSSCISSLTSNVTIPYTFTIFSFTPPSDIRGKDAFYAKSFNEKLRILVAVIEKAARIYQDEIHEPSHKKIFVAPEDLFFNFSESGPKCYYSQDEKNIFKATLLKLSETIDMIIAPGTFCWWKEKDELNKFRNNLYLFYKGEVVHYNKHNPYHSDFGFRRDCTFGTEHYNFEFSQKARSVFHSKQEEPSILEVGGLNIGVEICFDHTVGALETYLKRHPEKTIDLHLLVSNPLGTKHTFSLDQERGFVFIHVDRLDNLTGPYRTGVTLEGGYKRNGVERAKVIRQHFIYDSSGPEQDFFPIYRASPSPSRKRDVLPASQAAPPLDLAEVMAIVMEDPPRQNRIPHLMQIFDFLVEKDDRDSLLEVIKALFSLNSMHLIELDESEDCYYPIEVDIIEKFVSKYLDWLMDNHRIEQAVRAAQQFVILKNDFSFVRFIYSRFTLYQQPLAGITVTLTLPKEHQKNEILRPFYEEIMSKWTGSENKDRNLVIANFSAALAKYGNEELAREWASLG